MPPDRSPEPEPDSYIEPIFRNGSMTVVGVLTAFSLGILTQWADDPTPWLAGDIAVVTPMVAGIALQLWALARLLRPDSLATRLYRRAIRGFLWGLSLLAVGVVLGVIQVALAAT